MIIEGNLVTDSAILPRHQILCDPRTGRIRAVGRELGPPDFETDAFVLPGFIDSHVHARQYPRPPESLGEEAARRYAAELAKESFATAAAAALQGGVTAFLEMPNNPIPPGDEASYSRKLGLTRRLPVTVLPVAALTPRTEPFRNVPFKLMLDARDLPHTHDSLTAAEESLRRFRGQRVIIHCEDPDLLREAGGRAEHHLRHPPEAEIAAIRWALECKEKHGFRLHVAHLSTAEGLALIREANCGKAPGERVTCEVTPHHLYFSLENLERAHASVREFLVMNPPLRQERDRQALLEGLRDGEIDIIATDHAPHTVEEKRTRRPGGVPHLDTLGAFVGWLVAEQGFTVQQIARLLCSRPAEIWGETLGADRGRIIPGAAADLTVLDLQGKTRIPTRPGERSDSGFRLRTRCGWSPFAGIAFPAAVAAVFVAGKPRYP